MQVTKCQKPLTNSAPNHDYRESGENFALGGLSSSKAIRTIGVQRVNIPVKIRRFCRHARPVRPHRGKSPGQSAVLSDAHLRPAKRETVLAQLSEERVSLWIWSYLLKSVTLKLHNFGKKVASGSTDACQAAIRRCWVKLPELILPRTLTSCCV